MSGGWKATVVLGCVWVAGCAAAPTTTEEAVTERPGEVMAEEPVEEIEWLEAGIWDVRTGERLDEAALFEAAAAARFVVVGESHGAAWHHEVQESVLVGMVELGGEPAVGLEMVEARFQETLDAYVAGEIGEQALLHGVEWETRWGVDHEYYAPLWRRARVAGLSVVGLNVPREVVRAVGRGGLDSLEGEDAELVPDMDLDDREYRDHLRAIFEAHGMGDDEEALDRFFQAQVLWDEAMAQRAFEAAGDDGQVLLIVGRGHMERGFGIPPRLVRRGAAADEVLTVVPVSTEGEIGEAMEEYRDLRFLQSQGIADVVWVQ